MRSSSIRWNLIGWFGALLALVLVVFGTILVTQVYGALMASVDARLRARAAMIVNSLDYEDDEDDEEHGWDLELSDPQIAALSSGGGGFQIWDASGHRIAGEGLVKASRNQSQGEGIHDIGPLFRYIRLAGPRGSTVIVQVRAGDESAQALKVGVITLAAGVGVLALALLGGWFIARRSVAPIEEMASQAAAISETDLSARLSTESIPSELQGVVKSFNGTLERLDAAFTRQAQFTADASHELRTPVAIIRTQAEAALRKDRTAEDYKTSLEACARAAVRMTAIVEGLLTLARADGGAAMPHAPCDLKAVVDEAVAPLTAQAAADGMTLACESAPATVHGDEGLLGEVVTNLVTNALRYNTPGGSVDVSLTAVDGHAELRVRDTGTGIPAEALPHLFERFYRVDAARSREQGGSGLGLAITKWIVEAHGGEIKVESTDGEGTTFTVRLPVVTHQ